MAAYLATILIDKTLAEKKARRDEWSPEEF